jgi:hypothetical protein
MIRIFVLLAMSLFVSVTSLASAEEAIDTVNSSLAQTDDDSLFTEVTMSLVLAFQQFAFAIFDLGWLSLPVSILLLLLSAGIIYGMRRLDKNYSYPWLYYILYFITMISTWGLFGMSLSSKASMTRYECILSFFIMLSSAALTIFAGWGVRECGMEDGKYHKNFNRIIGQILQFPVWMFVSIVFYCAFLDPIVDWSDTFVDHDGGFWRFILGLIIGVAIVAAVLCVWVVYVMPYVLKTAGKWPIRIMTIILWWAMVLIGFNWAYANYDGLSYVILLVVGGISFFICFAIAWYEIGTGRCTMCHSCDSREEKRIDHGLTTSTGTHWTSASEFDIQRKHTGSKVSDVEKLVRTTTTRHHWTSIRVCSNCGKRWKINLSKEVDSKSEDLEYKWKERY